MREQYFLYDDQRVNFEPYEPSIFGIRRPITCSAILSLFLSLGLILSGITPSLQQWFHSRHQAKLLAQLDHYTRQYAHIEQNLAHINRHDQELYRSILTLSPIDPNVWNAGTGGSVNGYGFSKDVAYQLTLKSQKLKYQLQVQQASFGQIKSVALQKMAELRAIPAYKPMAGNVNCGFNPHGKGRRHNGCSYKHPGVDIPAPIGTHVFAAADGVVTFTGWSWSEWGYGIQVVVDHGNGYVTRYAHLSYAKPTVGTTIKRGELIAYSGTTGMSTGPHLHYEVLKNKKHVDPMAYFLLNT